MDNGRTLKGYASRRGSGARVGGDQTGPTRAPNLGPTRRLRRQSPAGANPSNSYRC
jgi:hypothetical protein